MHNLWRAVGWVCLLAMVALPAAVAIWHWQGGRLLSVQSASMQPTFRRGDALLLRPTRRSRLRVGQIITYRSAANPKVLVSHRLVRLGHRLTTEGDNLHQVDPPVADYQLVGQVIAVAPRLGRLLGWLRTPYGLIFCVYLPAASYLGWEVRRAWRQSQQRHYKLRVNRNFYRR